MVKKLYGVSLLMILSIKLELKLIREKTFLKSKISSFTRMILKGKRYSLGLSTSALLQKTQMMKMLSIREQSDNI